MTADELLRVRQKFPKRIGDKTPFGKIAAIGCIGGERYYWCIKKKVISMMPACVIE